MAHEGDEMVFVVGATGNIGKHVVQGLAAVRDAAGAHKYHVYAIGRDQGKVQEDFKDLVAADLVTAVGLRDWHDPAEVDQALSAAKNRTARSTFIIVKPFVPDFVEYNQAFADAVERASAFKLAVVMTALGYEERSRFEFCKLQAECEAAFQRTSVPCCVLRPGFFHYNNLHFAATIKSTGAFYHPYGDAKIAPIDVQDIATCIVAVTQHPEQHAGKSYSLTGPELINHDELAELFTKVLGKPAKAVPISVDTWAEQMKDFVPPKLVEWLAEIVLFAATPTGSGTTDCVERLTGKRGITTEQWVAANKEAFA